VSVDSRTDGAAGEARGASTPAAAGVDAVASEALTDRLTELTLASAALGRETRVRILVPAGFDPADGIALPVLWLLHGGMDDVTSWTERGDAEALTADLDLIVVMPDGGLGGWYSDWHNTNSAAGNLRWESHHLGELRPWIEQRFATRTDRAGRAIAGLSMGGFGALSYAARHPHLFGFAAAFSAALDILDPGVGKTADFTSTVMGATPGDIWGRWPAHRSNRRAHNPLDLAENLATLTLELRTGNGQPGGRHGGSDPVEAGIHGPMVRMHERLTGLGIDHVWDDYGPGAHDWPYWADDLAATLPGVMAVAGHELAAPQAVRHLAYEPTFAVWGWRVALDRPCLEPALLDLAPDGFTLTGSGHGTVTTDATFTPSATVRAHIGSTTWDLAADDVGRVSVTVDLGPPNRVDVDDRDEGDTPDPVTVEVRLTELG
jgi:S-formylglutathione hydrolase FrmB